MVKIAPQSGVFDDLAADHYVKLFFGLKEKGIKVFATLVHASAPLWFHKEGKFSNADNLKYFGKILGVYSAENCTVC